LVPWTRKAHELALHAREEGCFFAVHRALFEVFLLEGRDFGRVDVLLKIAVQHGLDLSLTKAVLDVDRHAPMITAARARAERLGVRGVPTLRVGDRTLEGFQNQGTILAFLQQAAVP
jgi:predicted DsbA family dithiol-disulfide isomerase